MRSTACCAPFNKTILENHWIVDAPTVHTSHRPELFFTDIVDETFPALDHLEPIASCARHKSSCSALAEGRGRCPYVRGQPDASSGPHNHAEPLDGWELTQIAQFGKVDEASNMAWPLREVQQKQREISRAGRLGRREP